jgi:hypothetical protein
MYKFCGKQLRTISTVTILYKTCKSFFKLAYELQKQLLQKKAIFFRLKNFKIFDRIVKLLTYSSEQSSVFTQSPDAAGEPDDERNRA